MKGRNWTRHDFATRGDLAESLAQTIADRLRAAVAARDKGVLAVSGGSTPKLLFQTLAGLDLAWDKIAVTLVDERYVEETSPRSNAGLVKANLLTGKSARARFLPLAMPLGDIGAARNAAEIGLRLVGLPIDVVVLGMGNDGHTASFFPDAKELDDLLDPKATPLVSSVDAQSAGEPRLTLTLPPIASAHLIALHIEGAEKAATLEKALSPGSSLPIRRVIDAAQMPVEIFWAA